MNNSEELKDNLRRKVVLLGGMPPDMVRILGDGYDLLDETAVETLSEHDRASLTVGLTTAMHGASLEKVSRFPGLKTIVSIGAGQDKFDLPWLSSNGITVMTTQDVMTEDTAEFAVGLVFAALRKIVLNDRWVRRGDWETKSRPGPGRRISETKIGIVGLGRIGGRIATKLSGLGAELSYTGRSKKDVDWPFIPDINDLARQVDVLILSCVGGAETRGLVDKTVLKSLGNQGFIINVARGSVVNEQDLIDALETEGIAGAALDVFENEPSPNPRFFALENCILEPHSSVFTSENRRDLAAELKRLLEISP